MQRWNGDADIEDILVGAVGRRRSGDWGEWRDVYTLSGVKQTASEKVLPGPGSPIWRSVMT